MAPPKPVRRKKFFSVTEANAALPLVRAIIKDITELAHNLQERQERLSRVVPPQRGALGEAYREELQHVQADQERMREYADELKKLGVELKDPFAGLIDFPCWMDDHEVYLCWRLGEMEVAHWHEIDAGFAGRQKLMAGVTKV